MRRLSALLRIGGVAAALILGGCGGGASSASTTIAIHFSHFEQERLNTVSRSSGTRRSGVVPV